VAFGESAWTALGFVLGMAAGGGLAAKLAGRKVAAGRCCASCCASLSPWPRVPFLSWFGTRPHCPRCGLPAPRLRAALEAAVVLIALVAIFASPPGVAVFVALAGWALLLLLVLLWRRFG
jgi:prepilin signal peptidase PulO-like enzyme (type II secretory pathway)